MRQLEMLMDVALEIILKIKKIGSPEARDFALHLADASLDWFEDRAARTPGKLDDEILKMIRNKLGVPEFEDEPEAPAMGVSEPQVNPVDPIDGE